MLSLGSISLSAEDFMPNIEGFYPLLGVLAFILRGGEVDEKQEGHVIHQTHLFH